MAHKFEVTDEDELRLATEFRRRLEATLILIATYVRLPAEPVLDRIRPATIRRRHG